MNIPIILLSIAAALVLFGVLEAKARRKLIWASEEKLRELQTQETELQKQSERIQVQIQALQQQRHDAQSSLEVTQACLSNARDELAQIHDDLMRADESFDTHVKQLNQQEEELASSKRQNLEQTHLARERELNESYARKESELASQYELRRNQLDETYTARKEQLESDFLNESSSLEEEINNLKSKRAQLIAAQLREEEIEKKKDFYRMALPLDDQEDVEKLLRFAKEFHSQQPLRKLVWSEFFLKPFGEMAGRVLGTSKICGVYKITNLNDGRIYIGQSKDVKTRWSNHIKAALGIDSIAHSRVHDAMAAEGIWNFTFELLEQCDASQLNDREKFYIDFYQSNTFGYNKTVGGS